MDPFAQTPGRMNDTFFDWPRLYAPALRQTQRGPLHAHAHHPHERHGVRGQLVFAPVFPPLRRQRTAPPARPHPPRRTAAAKADQYAQARRRDHPRTHHRLRAARRGPHRSAGADGGRRVCQARARFRLLEDFDHLYRYADLLDMETGVKAEDIVGRYTEIMPGRPTIAHHRHPCDSIKKPIDRSADPVTKLAVGIITAAEQQTMNYYMNVCGLYPTELGRKLYQEIGMVEEQHVSQYGSLMDVHESWLEGLLMHQYTECYLYWSCVRTETCPAIRDIWQQLLEQEIVHLHIAASLLRDYERRDWQEVIPHPEFPAPLALRENIAYVRNVLQNTVCDTAVRESWENVLRPQAGLRVLPVSGHRQQGRRRRAQPHGHRPLYRPKWSGLPLGDGGKPHPRIAGTAVATIRTLAASPAPCSAACGKTSPEAICSLGRTFMRQMSAAAFGKSPAPRQGTLNRRRAAPPCSRRAGQGR